MTTSTRNWIAPPGSAVFETAAPAIARQALMEETDAVLTLCARAEIDAEATQRILTNARRLATAMRSRSEDAGGLDSFMVEYDLSSREGIVLMCLAEALLRIPDNETADRLIADRLGDADFHEHLGRSRDLLVNVSTWGLLLSGRLLGDPPTASGIGPVMTQMLARLGEPVIRTAMRTAMRLMSEHFVMGETIEAAVARAATADQYRYSFDMLGEAALTRGDADEYFEMYAHAISVVAGHAHDSPLAAPGISVKLSALSQRFELAQTGHLEAELIPRLRSLAKMALQANVSLTVDAEEAERLEPTLYVFERVYRSLAAELAGHLGLAVQAYQKRGIAVIDWLAKLAQENGATIPVRLVKGAYWDTEIKLAQMRGLAGFPVFTRKASTDVSYLACARALLSANNHLYPQFATHNPHTVAWVLDRGADTEFEFQRLHGMGEELYDSLPEIDAAGRPCRVYAPVGAHERLLPYLVRRLLENGANTSFVNRFVDAELDVDELIRDPVARTHSRDRHAHPRIRLPRELFGDARENSAGLDLADPTVLRSLAAELCSAATADRSAAPILGGIAQSGDSAASSDPTHRRASVGQVVFADAATMSRALDRAWDFFPRWNATPAAERARILRKAAALLEQSRAQLVVTCVAEGGRTVPDALSEVREAVDFLRYYASSAEALYGDPVTLPGPTGELNTLRMTGRGVFVCISPWNFPIAIFTGQIAAALAAGNTVIAKPAEHTALVAADVVRLLFAAGLPGDALQFLPGPGRVLGETLLPDPRVAGVAFTGSSDTAKTIERTLARRDGPIAALIAETGGVNAMIVDSSALTEQVVRDAVVSAFNSA
ncbi:MAG TPA: bifunctional proline dehydrogenase/L-glutamate gamma-semialdehyde dehydrogenase PutA, partial [Gammaproteobacteria bacterium]|nr:bifunctional proline dehydrogenase/L-glutamate gamma-semialdehyde dehydrogenase PutA [Gammaproteobacteria bacterium]